MPADADRYEAYYAEKLWALIPSVYRAEDAVELDGTDPLRELCARIAVQAAVIRRSIDRLWEDQSIETCDDWVIPYIADLLATNLVQGLGARGQRLDVAKTIYYRRRKGTVAVLEEIAADITGWDARVVEFFRRLARSRHRLDPPIGRPLDHAETTVSEGLHGRLTRTPMGGLADLRHAYGASRAANTAFDEAFHTADVRPGRGRVGWHNIPRLGVFVWRLRSLRLDHVDPVLSASDPRALTFDPTGREIQLFAVGARDGGYAWNEWVSPREQDLRTPISQPRLTAALADLYAASDTEGHTVDTRSIAVFRGGAGLVHAASFTADPRSPAASQHVIDAERGLLSLAAASPPVDPAHGVVVSYCYGFSSNIGAGPYERAVEGVGPPEVMPEKHASNGAMPTIPPSGTLVLDDSRTYAGAGGVTSIAVDAGATLVIKAGDVERPLVRFPSTAPQASPPSWTFTGSREEGGVPSSLWLDGLFLSGGVLELAGQFGTVTLSACTLDPGNLAANGEYQKAIDGQPLIPSTITVSGSVARLVVDRSITGPIVVTDKGSVDRLLIQDSIVQALGDAAALDVPTGITTLSRVTVLGRGALHRLAASESILHDVMTVMNCQDGCVRFTASATGSALPRRYESVEIEPRQALFTSITFGDPGYAQLLDVAPDTIAAGAEDGSEMGAFSREKNSIKDRALLTKLGEYMPVGLAPVVVHVT